MLKSDMGYSPVRHDFVYLYAAVHTILILLFYIPAQLQLAQYKTQTEKTEAPNEPKKNLLSNLSGQMKKTTDVLVVGAPLVASLVQWLISLIFEN